MSLIPSIPGLFKWRQFEPEVILLAIGWYLRFSLSYRDVEELLAERGSAVDHVTLWRWVQKYAPELERRLRKGSGANFRYVYVFVWREALQIFMQPRPRPKFPERWLLFRLVV